MNFMAAFPLMISGGKEKETFWFFAAILEKQHQQIPFDGLSKFYENGFSLLLTYIDIFKDLFKEWIPELQKHFEEQGIIDCMWI